MRWLSKDCDTAVQAWVLWAFVAVSAPCGQLPVEPILEAALRYEIDRVLRAATENSAASEAPAAFCIQIRATERAEPADPDATLLARFRDHRPAVKAGSECAVRDWKVYDKSSGDPAVILDFGPVVHRPEVSEADVSGAPYLGGRVAREFLYRLILRDEEWVVHDVEVKIQT